ncbi:serine/threonine protein kinase [Nostoc calcicola FACHB-389]|nr:AAA family ATPase [Nostoc calcicola FACHB-3891]OKH22307.1 serine/threonine protein kinase [Nostoc calcicola FACHB-389]
MVALTGYQIHELIYSGSKTLVHRGIRESDKKPVVIKLLRREYPTFYELVRFRNQYTIAKNLDIDGIIKTYSLENYQNSYALIMEDLGGISLQEEMEKYPQGMGKTINGLQTFFDIALQIVSILDGLYQNRVIHKDIKPANILINPTTKEIRLIDFSIASLLSKETQTLTNPNILEGTLAYLSPEQTGRMNRGIDYRSDFYSLGVTFFELLTGELPFKSDEPMELLYCHLAKLPPPAHTLNPNIPPILSEIIAKLMAKNAEDRYQSALGLKYDLEICCCQWRETGSIEVFELGVRDICDRFIIPEKLYGRQAEVESLLAAFERIAQGDGEMGRWGDGERISPHTSHIPNTKSKIEMILVAGFSGVGKTAVVNEVHKPIVRSRGYFIKGKYDQFQRNIPLAAFVQAFRDLIGQLLSETDTQLERWKGQILTALGENAQVIIEVIPELEKIIGQQPPVAKLSGNAGQHRFNLLFQKFIQVFTTKDHPLVIFLDDLQWADSASLKFMQLLMCEAEINYTLLIGAYRDNEVYPAHPLMLTLGQIEKTGANIHTITLAPLKHTDLNYLIADVLNCELNIAQPLTDLVYQKTQGNPLFTNQLLKLLHEEKLIIYNLYAGYWQCDIAQVKAITFTDDLVEFLVLQLQKLPQATQKVLQLAACIDNQFDLATLAIVHEKSSAETAVDLWKALQEGLVIPTSEVYKFYQQESELIIQNSEFQQHNSPDFCSYKFLHDRVQQAAYSLIPEDRKQAVHLKIGRLMLKNISPEHREEHVFKLVNQLNLGSELITQPEEQEELAKLNLTASHKARNATAYEAAVEYANFGIRLLRENCWQYQYNLALSLYSTSAEVAHLNGDFEQTEQWIQLILQHGKTLIDKVKAYEVRILSQIAQNRMLLAIKTGLQVLKLLGVQLPEQPTMADIGKGLQETQLALKGKSIEDLLDLELMTEPDKLAAMNILTNIAAAAYLVIPELYPLILFKQVNLSLQYGNTANSLYGYPCYGLILCAVVGDVESGYQFSQLTLRLLDKLNAKEFIAKTYTVIYGSLSSWKKHIREMLHPIQLGYSNGIETGDLEFAGYCVWIYSFNAYLSGKELVSLSEEIANYSQVLRQLRQEPSLHKNELYRQVILNLLSKNQNPCYLIGEAYNEEIMLPLHQQGNDKTIICFLYFNKLVLCYLFAEYHHAVENAELAQNYLESVLGSITVPLFYFYDSLSQLAVYSDVSEDRQAFILERVTQSQEKMQMWADHAPMNHLHKFYLVEAERYCILGEYIQAMEMYDRAIHGAKENEYVQEEALAHELAAKFYLKWGKEQIAQTYLTKAYYCYVRWGAKAKVSDLEKRYPQLLAPILQWETIRFNSTEKTSTLQSISLSTFSSTATISSNSNSISDALDLATVLKASQALSSEIHLDNLLSTLIQVVMENTGAKKSALILLRNNIWVIEAIATFDKSPIILQSIPIELSKDIPLTPVNYVKNTLETLVIDDATLENSLASDSYVIQQKPKSLLCTPILHQGKLIGILYLENNLIAGVFTRNRLQVINLLCSQAAISLENAYLYQRSQENAQQLQHSLRDLQQMQLQLVQSEKMSALGNLIAGVAHEINNPVGFIAGNIQPAVNFIKDLFHLIDLYQKKFPHPGTEIVEEIAAIDLEYLREDLPKLIDSMKLGVNRILSISNSLRTFSRADTEHKVAFNIHEGIDSAILILKHRLKASENHPEIQIVKDYGNIPLIECFPGQLNQVFMNLLANAIDALEEANIGCDFQEINNKIQIHTCLNEDKNQVLIRIQDNGVGMSDKVKQKIFEHLFTTKAVGKGTGLGLAIAWQIIVEKHGGTLEVNSVQGEGSEFVIQIPISM